MPFRLLKYLVRIWDRHRGLHKKERRLPLVIPLVLYHGKNSWNVTRFFSEALEDSGDLGIRLPELEYLLLDLSRLPDRQIKHAIEVEIALALFKHIHDVNFIIGFARLIPLINELSTRETGLEYIETFVRYVYHKRSEEEVDEVLDLLKEAKPEVREVAMTTIAEHFIQQGVERGHREGHQEGLQEGQLILARRILLEFFQERFGPVPASLQEKIFEVQDHEILVVLLRELSKCASAEDFESLLDERCN